LGLSPFELVSQALCACSTPGLTTLTGIMIINSWGATTGLSLIHNSGTIKDESRSGYLSPKLANRKGEQQLWKDENVLFQGFAAVFRFNVFAESTFIILEAEKKLSNATNSDDGYGLH
jgi:hypothetical protein